LENQRQRIADKLGPSKQQKTMFNDLKKIINCKLNSGKETESSNKGQKFGNNVNVLQLWSFYVDLNQQYYELIIEH